MKPPQIPKIEMKTPLTMGQNLWLKLCGYKPEELNKLGAWKLSDKNTLKTLNNYK